MALPDGRPFLTPRPTLVTSPHSQLRQEHDYLQQCMRSEEQHRESLLRKLKQTETQLQDMRSMKSSTEAIQSRKKNKKKLRCLLNKNVRNWETLSERLTMVIEEMNRLENLQWLRITAPTYPRRTFLDNHTASLPCWSSIPPGAPIYTIPTPHAPFPQSFYSLADQMMINFAPQTPVLQPIRYFSHPVVYVPPGHNAGNFVDFETSPTDTVSSYVLSPGAANTPTSFSAASVPAFSMNLATAANSFQPPNDQDYNRPQVEQTIHKPIVTHDPGTGDLSNRFGTLAISTMPPGHVNTTGLYKHRNSF